jgi:hypothetical protein
MAGAKLLSFGRVPIDSRLRSSESLVIFIPPGLSCGAVPVPDHPRPVLHI